MSWSDRRSLLLGALALSGCGFRPVFGPDGDAEGLRGKIDVDPPRDDAGFELVRQLEKRLGLPSDASYRIAVDIALTEAELGITPDQEITRFNIRGRASYTLYDLGSGAPLTNGEAATFTSYTATGTQFATDAARRDARVRLMVALADQIVSQLLVTSGSWAQ